MKIKTKTKIKLLTITTALLYCGAIVWWHIYQPSRELTLQNPGADNRPEGSARAVNDVRIGEFFMQFEEISSTLTGKWSRFRGEAIDNIVKLAEPLDIAQSDYQIQWSVSTGEGHAAPVIYNGRVYFLDYDEAISSDMLRCFSLESGKELWRRWYRVPLKRNHGFSRTIPAVADDYIVTLGPQGHVMCCDPVSGELKWTMDLQKDYQTEVPFWYAGQCPLVEDHRLVLATAGDSTLMIGVDVASGEVLWQTPNSVSFKMSHSSIIPMTLAGKKTFVYIGVGGVCGVSDEGADRGAILWSATNWQPSVIAPSPVRVGANSVFLVAGYGAGGALLNVTNNGGTWSAIITKQYKASEGISSEQQTPIYYKDMLISVIPKDGGANRGKLVCYSPSNLGTALWRSGPEERFGLGPYMVIGDKIFVLKDDGELYVYLIEGKSMRLLKQQRIMEGIDAWGPMAYADGRLIVRDAHTVHCLRIE